jgi:hypothetical protein
MNPAFIMVDMLVHTVQPLTYTHHSVKDLPLMTRGVDAEGRPQRTVYLPAGQFRGRLRHEAAMAALRAQSDKPRLEDAYLLALGQNLDRQEDDEPEAVRLGDQLKFRRDNPFLDLFGIWKVSSRLFVSHLLPPVNVMPERVSHIRRDLDSNEDLMGLLDGGEQDRMYDRQAKQALASKAGTLIKLTEGELRAARKAKDTALIDQLERKLNELEDLKKQHKGQDDSDNTKHLVELQVIPAGLDLLGRITVQAPRQTDLAFLTQALDGLSRKPLMGAQRARGCGEIRGRASFRTPDGEVLAAAEFGDFQPAKLAWTAAGHVFMGTNAA